MFPPCVVHTFSRGFTSSLYRYSVLGLSALQTKHLHTRQSYKGEVPGDFIFPNHSLLYDIILSPKTATAPAEENCHQGSREPNATWLGCAAMRESQRRAHVVHDPTISTPCCCRLSEAHDCMTPSAADYVRWCPYDLFRTAGDLHSVGFDVELLATARVLNRSRPPQRVDKRKRI